MLFHTVQDSAAQEMRSLAEQLASKQVLIFDGAMGSTLLSRIVSNLPCLELLNLERPDVITEISRAFVDAGATVLQTNTFGASPLRLKESGVEGQTAVINQRGVEIAREAGAGGCFVVGSCGPSGFRIPEQLSAEEAYCSYAEQIEALEDADGILVETMMDLDEALIALKAARQVLPGKPVLVTLVFEPHGRTRSGSSPEDAAAALEAAGAAAVGANCGSGSQFLAGIARKLVAASRLPVLMQPSAGLPQHHNGSWIYPDTPEIFGSAATEMLEAGIRLIGGCCGTTPEYIRVLQASAVAYLSRKENG